MFLDAYQRDEMLMEGLHGDTLNKIPCNAGDKKASGVDVDNKIAEVYKMKYKIHLDTIF